MKPKAWALNLACLGAAIATPAYAENITFPVGSGVLNVTAAPCNAVPNDAGDDTAAIQGAITAVNRTSRTVYLPNRTYNEGWGSFSQLQGRSRCRSRQECK